MRALLSMPLFVLSLVSVACAHGRVAPLSATPAMPPMAQVQSAFASPRDASMATAPEPLDARLGAAVYLERALDALRDDQPAFATAALRAALATGDLNESGRALAYWYIYVAEKAQGHHRLSNDALSDFVSVADGVMQERDEHAVAQSGGSEFIERFDLAGRLARGRALLNLAWAQNHHRFGRSSQEPVPVQSEAEMAYFVELVPACQKPLDPRVVQTRQVAGRFLQVRQIDLRCRSEQQLTTYYFQWSSPARP